MPPVTRSQSRILEGTTRQSLPITRNTRNTRISKTELTELNLRHNKKCMLCARKEISEMLYGKLYQRHGIVVHFFCILLSSRSEQKGVDNDGIRGFLVEDIKAEIVRGSRETCTYCKKRGATISCNDRKCSRTFHLPCGLANGSMHQFFGTFKSFCVSHRIRQTVDFKDLQNSTPVQCSICTDDVLPVPSPTTIWAPCCKRNRWFHRHCIQNLALSAAHLIKCPLCSNVETFKNIIQNLGIYIPSRDASWEHRLNAFTESSVTHYMCNALKCLCPYSEKRKYRQVTGSWSIILCYTCGSNGIHKLCSSLHWLEHWFCSICQNVTGDSYKMPKRIVIASTVTNSAVLTSVESGSQSTPSFRGNESEIRESPRINSIIEISDSELSTSSTRELTFPRDPRFRSNESETRESPRINSIIEITDSEPSTSSTRELTFPRDPSFRNNESEIGGSPRIDSIIEIADSEPSTSSTRELTFPRDPSFRNNESEIRGSPRTDSIIEIADSEPSTSSTRELTFPRDPSFRNNESEIRGSPRIDSIIEITDSEPSTSSTRESTLLRGPSFRSNTTEITDSQPSTSSSRESTFLGDTIVISSDEDSSDEDVQCIAFVPPPRRMPPTATEVPMPIILTIRSMCPSSATFQAPLPYNPQRNLTLNEIETVDLTQDDEEGYVENDEN